jgi:hypothetical protein
LARAAELAAELGSVFERLADTQAECRRIRAEAVADAQRIRADADERATRIVAAKGRTRAERSDAAARARARMEDECAALVEAGEHEAASVRACAAERLPILVDRVVTMVRGAGSGGLTGEDLGTAGSEGAG